MSRIIFAERIPTEESRFGRHILHDEQSRRYPYRSQRTGEFVTTLHARQAPVWNQGDLGACTGYAALGCVGTGIFYTSATNMLAAYLRPETAVGLYSEATHLDPWPGTYLPEDTGSDGLSVAKVLKSWGWISGYEHAFGLGSMIHALMSVPVIVGTNWYNSMDTPDESGLLRIGRSARVLGGHQYIADGVDVKEERIRITNSWGTDWGLGGSAWVSFKVMERLLKEQGDVTVFKPISEKAPTLMKLADPVLNAQQELWDGMKALAAQKGLS